MLHKQCHNAKSFLCSSPWRPRNGRGLNVFHHRDLVQELLVTDASTPYSHGRNLGFPTASPTLSSLVGKSTPRILATPALFDETVWRSPASRHMLEVHTLVFPGLMWMPVSAKRAPCRDVNTAVTLAGDVMMYVSSKNANKFSPSCNPDWQFQGGMLTEGTQ